MRLLSRMAKGARLWEDVAVGGVDVLGAGGFGLRSRDVEQLPRSREVVLALAFGEETVVTDAMETGREHVDEKAADELAGGGGDHLDGCGSVDAVVVLAQNCGNIEKAAISPSRLHTLG